MCRRNSANRICMRAKIAKIHFLDRRIATSEGGKRFLYGRVAGDSKLEGQRDISLRTAELSGHDVRSRIEHAPIEKGLGRAPTTRRRIPCGRSNSSELQPDVITPRGLIRRSSEPYLKVPSLGGLRCGHANHVCTDERGTVLFRSVLHPLR
jgi:hypothetical protein